MTVKLLSTYNIFHFFFFCCYAMHFLLSACYIMVVSRTKRMLDSNALKFYRIHRKKYFLINLLSIIFDIDFAITFINLTKKINMIYFKFQIFCVYFVVLKTVPFQTTIYTYCLYVENRSIAWTGEWLKKTPIELHFNHLLYIFLYLYI